MNRSPLVVYIHVVLEYGRNAVVAKNFGRREGSMVGQWTLRMHACLNVGRRPAKPRLGLSMSEQVSLARPAQADPRFNNYVIGFLWFLFLPTCQRQRTTNKPNGARRAT